MNSEYTVVIGIDAGTNTGYAQYNKTTRTYDLIKTMPIHQALEHVLTLHNNGIKLLVVVEDARKAIHGWGRADKNRLQGAGSVKRDAAIWEDFLKDKKMPHIMKRPDKSKTKWPEHLFKAVTGYTGRTSQHSRDAALMILSYH